MKHYFHLCMLLSSVIFVSESIAVENDASKVAEKVKMHNDGFVGEKGMMEMILKLGTQEIKRKMSSMSLEVSPGETKSLLVFEIPKDVRGTKLLTWSFENKDDSQWIYLPSLRRVKRITSSGKASSFMGSEFTFEDLRNTGVKKYTYNELATIKQADDTLWKYTRRPIEKSGYSKQVVTVSKKYMSTIQVDYYDRSLELLKVAKFSDFKAFNVKGKKMFRAGKIVMKNIQTKKESILIWSDRKLGVKLKTNLFKKGSLK